MRALVCGVRVGFLTLALSHGLLRGWVRASVIPVTNVFFAHFWLGEELHKIDIIVRC